jgi:NADH:ubiquinone oxidoreductase subunit F (NADH-binding)
MAARRILLGDEPVASLDEYRARGGGSGLAAADRLGPDGVVGMVRASGLRGRGGAGFPAGVKWAGLRGGERGRRSVVCNAAEGEPGTYKDRWLMRQNPYQILEGLAIAAYAVGAERAYIGVKAKFVDEIERITTAAAEMDAAGLLADVPVVIVPGPDDYLFGEEKGLLEVIEGRDPLPRLYPPYVMGLFADGAAAPGDDANPAVVNNVETLCNVPHILANGAEWFRSFGTVDTPGTMVFTICGDVRWEGVAELEMGTPLATLVYGVGRGLEAGRRPRLIVGGASNRPLTPGALDTPLDFGSMRRVGAGLGSGGFVVYDDTVCVVQVAAAMSAFLFRGSCGQCPPCKLGTEAITERFTRFAVGGGGVDDLQEIAGWIVRVTDANRCGLGAGQQAFAQGILEDFAADLADHLDAEPCSSDRRVVAPVIESWDSARGRFSYATPGSCGE